MAEDAFPHGTVDGFDAGCRGGYCPAGNEHGLSCRRARTLRAGDFQYARLVRRGLSPFEIAVELGLAPETNPKPKPKKEPVDVPVAVNEEPVIEVEEEPVVETQEAEKHAVVKRKGHTPKPALSASLTAAQRKACREWAVREGQTVSVRGRIADSTVLAWRSASLIAASVVSAEDLDAWAADREPVDVVAVSDRADADADEALAFVLQQWGEERARVERLEAENDQLRRERDIAWATSDMLATSAMSATSTLQRAGETLDKQRALIARLSARIERLTSPRPWWKRAVS